ncbi:TetR family transcriptional regulator [Mycobacterium malmoense]|nr:TetR family transcriptional regulator [Mycobacterium malmoense]
MTKPKARTRDGAQRRRELCDAAIEVLAEHGSRGLSHERVDRAAGVPVGSTSYYYRTRSALLQGVAARVAEIDTANLQSVLSEPIDTTKPFAHLARLTMLQADGSGLVLNKARHELLLSAARDPALAETSREFMPRIMALAQKAIRQLQPATQDDALLEAQTTAVTTFLAGVFSRFVAGDRTIGDPDQLARLFQSIAEAVALNQYRTIASTKAKSRTIADVP